MQENPLFYLYMLLVFNVTPEEYSIFNVVNSSLGITFLLTMMPLMTKVFKCHETVMLPLFLIPGSIMAGASAFAPTLIPGAAFSK
jgi:hypothetical protein